MRNLIFQISRVLASGSFFRKGIRSELLTSVIDKMDPVKLELCEEVQLEYANEADVMELSEVVKLEYANETDFKVEVNTDNDIIDDSSSDTLAATAGVKRTVDITNSEEECSEAKIPKTEGEEHEKHTRPFYKKKKVAVCLVYNGKGYTGMQMNPGMKTIERDVLQAFCNAGVITEEHLAKPSAQMNFMRGARTDKGVSAADVPDAITKINSHLVDQIRVLGFKRVTRGFSSKDSCSSRTYIYLLPTFAFTPVEEFVTDDYKMSEEVRADVNRILAMYKGTHSFHNFTSGKSPNDPSAQRYIMDMSIGEPFMKGNVEYAVITVKGQSFMLHQIRKMIGLTIAIVRGLASEKSMVYAWRPERADVPIAPGLGLMLNQLHYDAYNQRYGGDGMHEPIVWDEYKDQIQNFKDEHIFSTIIETEKKERSMMKWLETLHFHHFEPKKTDGNLRNETGLGRAFNKLKESEDITVEQDSGEKIQTDEGLGFLGRRAYNWSLDRVQTLYEALLKDKGALQNKTGGCPWAKESKKLAWNRVVDACNASYPDKKSLVQVQSKARNFNLDAKKRYNSMVEEMRNTGGGTYEENIQPFLTRADELCLMYQGIVTAGIEWPEPSEMIPDMGLSSSPANQQSTSFTNPEACTSREYAALEESVDWDYTSEDTGLDSFSKTERLSDDDEELKLIAQLTQVRKKKQEQIEEERRKAEEKARADKQKKEEEQRRLIQAEALHRRLQEGVSGPETTAPSNQSEHCCCSKLSQIMEASIKQQNELLKELVSANKKIGDILAKASLNINPMPSSIQSVYHTSELREVPIHGLDKLLMGNPIEFDLSNTIQDDSLNSTQEDLFIADHKTMGTPHMQLSQDVEQNKRRKDNRLQNKSTKHYE